MARKSLVVKSQKPKKFPVRQYNRCAVCGRPRGFYRRFNMCRICVRKYALAGAIPGVMKSSW
ncbi:MAG: type Z 30S ribosomal protein S14 [Deltaproteobacteria bacterium]|nr:type Z 30S ribosomal protein S14 [Deltaproteobacteria bacterium]MBW2120733.1 type Z 30S ribosomal protein S14 [Deltaproteobacteria bacterium]